MYRGHVAKLTRRYLPEDLVGAYELGELLHVDRRTVSNWYGTRYRTGFPEAVIVRAVGPLFSRDEVVQWWQGYRPANNHKRVGYLDKEGA